MPTGIFRSATWLLLWPFADWLLVPWLVLGREINTKYILTHLVFGKGSSAHEFGDPYGTGCMKWIGQFSSQPILTTFGSVCGMSVLKKKTRQLAFYSPL